MLDPPYQDKGTEGPVPWHQSIMGQGSRGTLCDCPPALQPSLEVLLSLQLRVRPCPVMPLRLLSALPAVPLGVERLQNPSGHTERGADVQLLVPWEVTRGCGFSAAVSSMGISRCAAGRFPL